MSYIRHEDHQKALCAVRDLNGHKVEQRRLCVRMANSISQYVDRTSDRGDTIHNGWPHNRIPQGTTVSRVVGSLPAGKPLIAGISAQNAIAQVLEEMQSSQIINLLSHAKV